MKEHEPFPDPPERKEFKVDFAYLAENEPEWLILASEKKDNKLEDRMRNFVMNVLNVNYINAEKAIVKHFIPALESHRKNNWSTVEENLINFYTIIETNSSLDFDAKAAGRVEKAIWELIDKDLTVYTNQIHLRELIEILYINLFNIDDLKHNNKKALAFYNACNNRAAGLVALKDAEHGGWISKKIQLKKMRNYIQYFWMGLDKIINE